MSMSNSMEIDVSNRCSTSSTGIQVPNAVDKTTESMRYLDETIDVISNGITAYQKELTDLDASLSQDFQSIETTEQKLEVIKTSSEESRNVLNGMQTNVSIVQEDLITLMQKYDDQQAVSHNGTLVWKITRVREKLGKH